MLNISSIIKEAKKVVKGKDDVLLWVLLAVLADGNVLMEDIPGVGKTTVALTFTKILGLEYGRVQFNPDVLPSDITGYSIYQKDSGQMRFVPGAIFCNLFLADELNRATSRTQSALLEAMEEKQVTVDGTSRPLPDPFFVIATQNPTGSAGTSLLPESQIDRFMVRLSMGYPKKEDELEMVKTRQTSNPLDTVIQLVDKAELSQARKEVANVFVHDDIMEYIVDLVGQTRNKPEIALGASPRATLALCAISKALAYVNKRDYVRVSDVAQAYPKTIAHRLRMSDSFRGKDADEMIRQILESVRKPRV